MDANTSGFAPNHQPISEMKSEAPVRSPTKTEKNQSVADQAVTITDVERRDLYEAIQTLLEGDRPDPDEQVPSQGCSIKWKD